LGAVLISSAAVTHAADINGVWASDTAVCNKVFTKKSGRVAFAKDADIHGSGFILEPGSVRGKLANCKIKTRKQDGDLVHLVASCATDMMLSNMELTLKVIDDNKVARVFAGMPELETLYYRCPQ
ncbi:MAG: hypothetical protein WCF49_04950, partial [Xanthobacteraceae bacterium]